MRDINQVRTFMKNICPLNARKDAENFKKINRDNRIDRDNFILILSLFILLSLLIFLSCGFLFQGAFENFARAADGKLVTKFDEARIFVIGELHFAPI